MDITRLPFDQGWTLDLHAEGNYIYLDWIPTGSMDPHLSDMMAHEARALAEVLLRLADRIDPPQRWIDVTTLADRKAVKIMVQPDISQEGQQP